MRRAMMAAALALLLTFGAGCKSKAQVEKAVRIGFFPNMTHAQALVSLDRGLWEKKIGGKNIKPKTFTTGPSAVEALFAKEVDMAFIGPFPAINAYVRSQGEAIKIIAGSAKGGALFVVGKDSGIIEANDLKGKRIATPQIGNSQDISAKDFLIKHGLKAKQQGGDVEVLPLKGGDILNLMKRGEIDGAWVPEPWAARILRETEARIFIDERELWKENFTSTLVVAEKSFAEKNKVFIREFLNMHLDTTRWIRKNPQKAKKSINNQIKKMIGQGLPKSVIDDAFQRIEFTVDPGMESVYEFGKRAERLGLLDIGDEDKLEKIEAREFFLKDSDDH